MSEVNKWGTALKIFLYLFDLLSDWINGVLLIVGNDSQAEDNNSSAIYRSDPCFNSSDGKPQVAWGGLTLAFSWGPACFGLLFLVAFDVGDGFEPFGLKSMNCLLLPLRFILWPLLVPIGM